MENTPVGPIGEYAQSALGRERMFENGSMRWGTPVVLLRLNYAVELRYGVLSILGEPFLSIARFLCVCPWSTSSGNATPTRGACGRFRIASRRLSY